MKALFFAVLFSLLIYCPAMAVEPTICESGEEEMRRSYSNFFDEESKQQEVWQIIEAYEICREEGKISIYESDIAGFVMELSMADIRFEMSEDGTTIKIPDLVPEFQISLITGDADPVDVE